MKRLIKEIVIHCSAMPNGSPTTVEDIDRMHNQPGHMFQRNRQAIRSFNPHLQHIGYHFFLPNGGGVDTGRGLEEVGAHVQGSNTHSIGICMNGLNKFDKYQWESLYVCVREVASRISGKTINSPTSCMQAYKDMGITLSGHRDHSPDLNGDGIIQRTEWIKDCPNFDVRDWVRGGMVGIKEATL